MKSARLSESVSDESYCRSSSALCDVMLGSKPKLRSASRSWMKSREELRSASYSCLLDLGGHARVQRGVAVAAEVVHELRNSGCAWAYGKHGAREESCMSCVR